MTGGYQHGGLEPRKYVVTKANGEPVQPGAEYFVLRVDKDPHALVALAAYAEAVYPENPQLARDLRMWIASTHLANAQATEQTGGVA